MPKHIPKYKNEEQRLRSEIQHNKYKAEHLLWMKTLPIDTPENDPDVELKDGVWVDVDHTKRKVLRSGKSY